MKVKQMAENQRPREKALMYGVEVLSDRELLAVLLRNGTKDKNVLELADEILEKYETIGAIGRSNIHDLIKIKGIKEAKALQIVSAFELGRRMAYDQVKEKVCIKSPGDVVAWLNQLIGYHDQEHFVVLFLNQRNQVMHYKIMFIGTLTSASVHPREIYKEALTQGCAKIMCAHNHPSGDTSPSQADITLTEAICACGKMIAIPCLDHIIVSHNQYLSFREERLID